MAERKYYKEEAIFEPQDVEEESEDSGSVQIDSIKTVPATQYSKGEALVEPTAFYVVFSNGTNRERDYFKWMMKNCPRLKLEFFGVPISPDDLLEEVKKKKNEYDYTSGSVHPDRFYTVTDVDHFYNDIIRSKKGYRDNIIQLIISNPCFEVWLYYSKRKDRLEGFKKPENPLKLSQEVKRFLNEKISGGCNPKRAVFDIKDNIENAKLQYEEDENGIPILFSTNMFLLAEDLLPLIESELQQQIILQQSPSSFK